MIIQLKPLIGINDISFGAFPAEIIKHFNEPDEIEELKDELLDDHVLVYHYWSIGISFFFSTKKNNRFTCIEIDHKETILFGEKIFTLNENQIIELLKQNNHFLSEKEQQAWGEKRLSFDSIHMDFYLEKGKLTSINYGIDENEQPFSYFPN